MKVRLILLFALIVGCAGLCLCFWNRCKDMPKRIVRGRSVEYTHRNYRILADPVIAPTNIVMEIDGGRSLLHVSRTNGVQSCRFVSGSGTILWSSRMETRKLLGLECHYNGCGYYADPDGTRSNLVYRYEKAEVLK